MKGIQDPKLQPYVLDGITYSGILYSFFLKIKTSSIACYAIQVAQTNHAYYNCHEYFLDLTFIRYEAALTHLSRQHLNLIWS